MIDLNRRTEIGGTEIAWDRWGPDSGTPLVLVHGFSGSAHDFALRIPELAAHRPVVAIDQRGHGLSDNLGDVDRYSLRQLQNDLGEFVDLHLQQPFDLLGHSMGGRVSLALTLDRPDRVRSLILMDTSAWAFVEEDGAVGNLLSAFLRDYDPADGLPDLAALDSAESALIERAASAEWQTIREQHRAAFDPYAMKALGLELFDSRGESLRDRLGELNCPVTVIAGEHDHPFVDQAEALAEETGGTATIIEGAYHSPQLTHATEWRAAVESHLAAV